MKRVLGALALTVLVAVPAASSGRARVTITARPIPPGVPSFPGAPVARAYALSGTAATRAAGERVAVLRRDCGVVGGGYGLVGDTRTAAGGSWRLEEVVVGSGHFRARWRGHYSRSILIRGLFDAEWELVRNVLRVEVETPQRMAGRVVQLQRRLSGPAGVRWAVISRARLRRVRFDRYETRFPIRIREATLRAYFPARTTRPCYDPVATEPFLATTRTAVTIRVALGGPLGRRQPVLSGRIASAAAGQLISVEVRACGVVHREWRSIHESVTGETTRTGPGGSWRWTYPQALDVPVFFRARWYPHYSDPVLVRAPLPIARRFRDRLLRVTVDTSVAGQNMRGRVVELQRRAGARWLRVREARLQRIGSGRWAASFRIRQRGLTLRAFVPARSAAPCYLETATRPFKS